MTEFLPEATSTKCSCCGADDWKRHRYTSSIWYLECLVCHYWVQRRSGVADLSAQFEAEQRKFYDEDSLLLSPSLSTLTREITDRRISTVLHHLPKGSSIIEAGPGSGDVIRSLADRGYAVSAVEHSPVLAKRLREQSGISVRVGDFADQQLPDATYDAYCSFHVIEHVTDFRKHLDVARCCVRKGGLAFIATPNSRGWEQRLPYRLSPNNDSSHFQLFSPIALSVVLEQTGWSRSPSTRLLTRSLGCESSRRSCDVSGELTRIRRADNLPSRPVRDSALAYRCLQD